MRAVMLVGWWLLMILLDVVVPGVPHPLQRARVDRGRAHDTPANRAAKDRIRVFARWKVPPWNGSVEVEIRCHYTRRAPTADVDNLAKTVLDAFNGYVLKDDRQVMRLEVSKVGSMETNETWITVRTAEVDF
jgi:Holliday junction resolvase RusA-like endonuclease